jgi:hypothetical protein
MRKTEVIESVKNAGFSWRLRLAGDLSGLHARQKRRRDAGATTSQFAGGQEWQVEQTNGAPCSLWQLRQTPIVVTLVASDILSISATSPWHIWHFIPASRCLRCVQVTPGRTL